MDASRSEHSRAPDAGFVECVRPHVIPRRDDGEGNGSGDDQAKRSKPDSEAMSHCLPSLICILFIYVIIT